MSSFDNLLKLNKFQDFLFRQSIPFLYSFRSPTIDYGPSIWLSSNCYDLVALEGALADTPAPAAQPAPAAREVAHA